MAKRASNADPSPDIAHFLGARLRSIRKERGLRQRDIADAMNTYGFRWDDSVVTRVEAGGRELRVGELLALLRVLEMRLADLLDSGDAATRVRLSGREDAQPVSLAPEGPDIVFLDPPFTRLEDWSASRRLGVPPEQARVLRLQATEELQAWWRQQKLDGVDISAHNLRGKEIQIWRRLKEEAAQDPDQGGG